MAEDVDREERGDRPVVAAAEPFEERLQAGERDRNRHQRHRHQVGVLEEAAGEGEERDDERAERHRGDEHDERREADEAAEVRDLAALAELRDVAHGRIAEAERGDGARRPGTRPRYRRRRRIRTGPSAARTRPARHRRGRRCASRMTSAIAPDAPRDAVRVVARERSARALRRARANAPDGLTCRSSQI